MRTRGGITSPIAVKLPLRIDPERGAYQAQIAAQLRSLVRTGFLECGDRIPASRLLSDQLGVARRTVSNVYEQLVAEGLLKGRVGAGTYVASQPDGLITPDVPSEPPEKRLPYVGRIRADLAPSLYVAPGRQFLYDFRLGKPDPNAFPLKAWRKLLVEQSGAAARAMSDYTDPAGHLGLREALCRELLPGRGIICRPEDIVIVGGTQDGVNLVGRLIGDPKMRMAIENPCYEGTATALQSLGIRLLAADVDAEGIRVDQFRGKDVCAAFVTPSHQFPLGSPLSAERRDELVEWAMRSGAIIVEDDYDSDVQYNRSRPALKAAAPDSVIYIGSFSKILGPGLRLGFVVLPRWLARSARAMKAIMSNGQPWLEQAVLAEFITSGLFDRHRRMIRERYRQRRDKLLSVLSDVAPGSEFEGLGGGLHICWRLPPDFADAETLRDACAKLGVGIYTLSGSPCFVLRSVPDQNRLVFCGYSAVSSGEIEQARARLARAVTLC